MKFLISQVIQREINDPRIGFITVLGVEPTEDVKEAKVYLTVLGKPGARSKAEHALASAKGFIQKEVGRNLQTRNTPSLRFVFDDSQDKASRIEALIQKASQEDRETTMAKKPSKKSSKPGRGEKPGKKSSKKGGGPLGDEEEDAPDEKGEAAAGVGSKSENGNGDDFESDFEGEDEGEKQDEADVNYDDFDEEYMDEEEDEEDEDEEEDEEDAEEYDEELEQEDEEEDEEEEEEEDEYGEEDFEEEEEDFEADR